SPDSNQDPPSPGAYDCISFTQRVWLGPYSGVRLLRTKTSYSSSASSGMLRLATLEYALRSQMMEGEQMSTSMANVDMNDHAAGSAAWRGKLARSRTCATVQTTPITSEANSNATVIGYGSSGCW